MIFYLLLHALTSIFFVECDTHEIKIEATEHESVKENMEHRKINTSFTTIIGQRYTFNKTKKGVSYLGIPFAKPPIGDRRFRPPEELEQSDWNDTFYALTSARSCAADIYESNFTGYSFWNPTNEVSEDCLQLNMWVPSKKDKVNDKKHCVIVYIYGGAFFSGSASLDVYNGSILAVISRCIVVNLNYRLGVLGFAFLNDGKTISGNMGLLDQQMGMKWVYENIHYFDGDNKSITLFGESAGSVSVISHLYAPDSFKYFSRIISNSGTAQNVWGRTANNYAHSKTIKFAKRLGCVKNFTQNPDYEKILYCLQHNVTTKNITDVGGEIQNNASRVLEFVFEPVENDTVFFKGNLSEKINNNDMKVNVSILIGKADDEFTYFMPYYFYRSKYNCSYNESLSSESEENSCNINENGYKNIFKRIARELKFPEGSNVNLSKLYNNTMKDESYRYKASRFLAEVYFDCDIYNWTMRITDKIEGPIYFYEFKVVSSSNPWPKWMGVMHGYELEYEFGLPLRDEIIYNETTRENEKNFSIYFMNLLGNFAKTGNPYKNWTNFSKDNPISNLLKIKSDYSDVEINKKILTKTCKAIQPYLKDKLIKRL